VSAAATELDVKKWPGHLGREGPLRWAACAERPLQLADLVSALSFALDLTGGQARGRAVRTCWIGMRLGQRLGLPPAWQADLYYALLLKDSGCSNNAARIAQIFAADDHKAKSASLLVDWYGLSWSGLTTALRLASQNEPWPRRLARLARMGLRRRQDAREVITLRCERGADIARRMGFSERTAQAVRSLDERWDGRGAPDGLRAAAIPLLARILRVAQTLALFPTHPAKGQAALEQWRGKWFDPEVVKAARALSADAETWAGLQAEALRERVIALDPGQSLAAGEDRLESVCEAFADVIDAKTPFTYRHSRGVAAAATAMARTLGAEPATVRALRRAALLHDIGKLGVSNQILDKQGPLTPSEWAQVKLHPRYTREILEHVRGWRGLAFVAAAHHERLDGAGYHLGLTAAELPRAARLIAVADVYDALAADRPYRAGLPRDEVFGLLRREAPRALDAECVEALAAALKS
jgi:putative nucleotidyltransferase with HDIG domain